MAKSCFLLLVCLVSVQLFAQAPLFTNDVAVVDDLLILSNKGTKSITIMTHQGEVIRSIPFTDPVTGLCVRESAIYATSSYSKGFLHKLNLASGEIIYSVETGMGARSPLLSADGSRVYVLNPYKNSVSEVDAATGKVLRQTEAIREPSSGVVTPDGRYLFVTNFLPEQRADVDDVAATVSVIDLSRFSVIKNIRLSNGSNALRGICITPDGQQVYVSHNLGRFQVPTSQLQQGWMNTSAISVIDIPSLSFVGTLLLDEPDRGAAGIWGVVCTQEHLFITHSGTHDLSIVDHPRMRERLAQYPDKSNLSYDLRFMYGIRKRLPLIGNGPRSITLAEGKLYIPTYFSDTLNVVDIASQEIQTISCNPSRTEQAEDVGERVFNDATYCYQNWQSCNGCHPGDARTDGMNWDLMNDGVGNPKNCKSLLYSHVTAPNMISGIRPVAEIAVRAGFKHIQFSEVEESLLECVDAYLKSLRPLPSPYLVEGELSEKAAAGRKVFEKLQCDQCHSGPYFTDLKMHRIGADIEFETGWDTPTLIEVWRTAPYLFDGRAATLKEVFSIHKHGVDTKISTREIEELTEYINSL